MSYSAWKFLLYVSFMQITLSEVDVGDKLNKAMAGKLFSLLFMCSASF